MIKEDFIPCMEDKRCRELAEKLKIIGKDKIEIYDGEDKIITPENSDARDYIAIAEDVLEELKDENDYPKDWDIDEMVIDEKNGEILNYCWLQMNE